MRRRAEQVDETRQRIVEATARLHTTVGPAKTTVAGIAEEAAVTRLTVYRHFPDLEKLFVACRAHWAATHPGPDPERWRAVPDLSIRVRGAIAELYAWYARNAGDLAPIYRDFDSMPPVAQQAIRRQIERVADALVGDVAGPDASGRRLLAAARHFVTFSTWRSLAVDQGLGEEAPGLASDLVLGALDAPDPDLRAGHDPPGAMRPSESTASSSRKGSGASTPGPRANCS